MKRILIGAAVLAALILPVQAGTEMAPSSGKDMKDMKQMAPMAASDAGFYVAAYGGANFDTWYGNNRQTLSNNATGSSIGTQAGALDGWGGVGGIKIGYNFESFDLGFLSLRLQPAVEAEGLYVGDDPVVHNAFLAGTTEKFTTNSGAFLVNGILRFKNSSIVTPYIGAGVGLEYVTTHGNIDFSGVGAGQLRGNGLLGTRQFTGLDTSDLDFAAQGIFGFDVAICSHISLFTEYKYLDAIGNDGKNSGPGMPANITYRFKPDQIEQNLITAGVKYTF